MANSNMSNSSSKVSPRQREDELILQLKSQAGQIALQLLSELLILRLERYKEQLIDRTDEDLRGRAKELRDLLKIV